MLTTKLDVDAGWQDNNVYILMLQNSILEYRLVTIQIALPFMLNTKQAAIILFYNETNL